MNQLIDDRRPGRTMRHRSAAASQTYESRSLLVKRIASHLTRRSAPRIHLLIVTVFSGAAAFLASAMLLWWGGPAFDRMPLRYATAALTGYVAFIALVRIWIWLSQRGPSAELDFDPFDLAEEGLEAAWDLSHPPARSVDLPLEVESGGSVTDGSILHAVRRSVLNTGSGGDGWTIDLDDLWWLVLAAACAIGGVLAVAYVIYIAPMLLAEVALDAAIVSAVYRRLREDEAGHWLTTIFTRTWLPAMLVVLFAMIAGFALQMIAPEAHSIGGVIQTLSS